MKTDDEIRDDVISVLRWDPQISDPEAIGVAVTGRAVVLTGHPSTHAEKLAAERAARRVYGVKAVASDLKVRLSGSPRDDADIAQAIARVAAQIQEAFEREAGVDPRHVRGVWR